MHETNRATCFRGVKIYWILYRLKVFQKETLRTVLVLYTR